MNIITRKDVDMTTIDAKSVSRMTSRSHSSAGWARNWERGSALVVGEYYDRTSLFKDERDATRNLDFTGRGYRDSAFDRVQSGTV